MPTGSLRAIGRARRPIVVSSARSPGGEKVSIGPSYGAGFASRSGFDRNDRGARGQPATVAKRVDRVRRESVTVEPPAATRLHPNPAAPLAQSRLVPQHW